MSGAYLRVELPQAPPPLMDPALAQAGHAPQWEVVESFLGVGSVTAGRLSILCVFIDYAGFIESVVSIVQ